MTNDGKPQLLYRENDAEVLIPLGLETPEIFNLEYRKDNFLVASTVKFSSTEDDEPVMVIRLDFLETPSTRIIKLYDLGDDTLSMVQSEIPGADFLVGLTDSYMTELSGKPLLGTVLEKFGADYIEYKIGKTFNSQLRLKLSE